MTDEVTWQALPLSGLLASMESGSRPKGGVRGIVDGIPSLGGEHLNSLGGFKADNVKFVPYSFYESMRRGHIQRGDVLVVKDGATTGKVSYVGDDFPYEKAVANEHLFVCRPAHVDGEYLFWYLYSDEGQRRILEHFKGSAQGGITRDFADGTLVPIAPTRGDQERLAGFLGAAFAHRLSADDHLAAAGRAIGRFRQAVLAAACSGRLTAGWREDNPKTPVERGPSLSGGALKNTSGSPNTSDLVDVPETWAFWTIESITSDVIDYRGRTPPHVAEGPIPHVRTTHIRRGRVDWQTDRFVTQDVYDEYMTRGLPKRGDVLFTMEAPMGEVGVIDRDEPFSIAQRILLLRPTDGVDGRFLALALQSHPVRQAIELRSTGSGVIGIAYKRLRSVEIPRPPLEEQIAIVERAERLSSLADSVRERIDTAATRVDRSSQAVLAKAFRGGLSATVGEQTT